MEGHVTRRETHRDARQHVPVALEQPPPLGGGDRLEVVGEIARAGALVGVPGELELPLLHHVGGVGERGPHVAPRVVLQLGVQRGVAAGVIEVEVGVDHPAHVARQDARRRERVLELGRALEPLVLDTVDVEELGVLLVAEPGVDQHQAVGMLDEQTAHGERDAVALVGLRPACSRACYGTTPNIAPPSSRCAPAFERVAAEPAHLERAGQRHASRLRRGVGQRLGRHRAAAPARPPSARGDLDRGQVLQRARAFVAGQQEEPAEQLGGDQRVAAGAVPGGILEPEPVGQAVEAAGADAAAPAAARAARCRAAARRAPGRAPAAARRTGSPSRTARCGPRRCVPRARPPPGPPPRRTSARAGPCRW